MQTFTFGLDISHHQDLGLDLAQCRREGIEFVFLKATEGSRFRDPEFGTNLAEARAAGQLVAAYHYVRGDVSALSQVMHITNVVPRDVAVIPDIEAGSGGVDLARQLVNQLRAVGYTVPLTYLPRWYWQQLGSPSLAGLPPLWSSRYPDNVIGSLADEWADVPSTYWAGYGGLDVAVLQFTSSVRIAGHQPIDANAYRGTRAQLAALLGVEEDDMFEDSDRADVKAAAWRLYSATQMWETVPTHAGVLPEAVRGEKVPLVTAVKDLQAKVARPAPVDLTDAQLDALADRVAARLGVLRFEAQHQGQVTMPDLVGRTLQEARAALAALGWVGTLTDLPGKTTDADKLSKIIDQNVPPNTVIEVTRDITVTVATQIGTEGA